MPPNESVRPSKRSCSRIQTALNFAQIHDLRHSCASWLDFLAAMKVINYWNTLYFSLFLESRELRPLQSVIR